MEYRETDLEEVKGAYPGARIWRQDQDYWILSKSDLLGDGSCCAQFLTGVSTQYRFVRGWGFWDYPIGAPTWIGPRHTYLDGSICAFEPSDGTWIFGSSLVVLLDLYTLWAFRHLYHEIFGIWPGPQVAASRAERLAELKDTEWCGCKDPKGTYAQCCKVNDKDSNVLVEILRYDWLTKGRQPPDEILKFIARVDDATPLNGLLTKFLTGAYAV